MKDAQWRQERARKAGLASARVRYQQALERMQDATPMEAYTAGYRRGYSLAYRYWKNWAAKGIRKINTGNA